MVSTMQKYGVNQYECQCKVFYNHFCAGSIWDFCDFELLSLHGPLFCNRFFIPACH